MDTIFFDGNCGMCNAGVRFARRRDPAGERFRFLPLASEEFERAVDPAVRATLPDSAVLVTAQGRVLLRSDAILGVMRRLGWGWRALAAAASLVPRRVRDAVYDRVAAARRGGACPVDVRR